MICYIDNKKINLEDLSNNHPGGKRIQAFENMDATVSYKSIHVSHDEDRINEYIIEDKSEMEKNTDEYIFDTDFAKDIKNEIIKKIDTDKWYAPIGWWIRLSIIIFLDIIAERVYVRNANIITAMFVGFMHAQIGFSIQHTASHGAVHSKAIINDFLALFADFIGSSKYMWFQQHIMFHHKDTNRINRDPDIHSAEPIFYFVRNRINRSRFLQLVTFPILYLYGLDIIYKLHGVIGMQHSRPIPNRYFKSFTRRLLFLFFKLFYIYRIVLSPWYQGHSLLTCLFFVPFFTGLFLVNTFILSHNTDEMIHTDENKKNVDWYKMQVESSCTYKSVIGWYLTDGLNYQIEHHLFPRMNPWHYPFISSTVKDICKKHNVKYTEYNGFMNNMKATVKYLFKREIKYKSE